MDRFSKTIDTDTAEFANIEDSTPTKHSKISKIIAIIVCFLLAIVMWLYVMEVSTDVVEQTFTDVQYFENGIEKDAKITVKVVGEKNFIADAKRADIVVHQAYGKTPVVSFVTNAGTIETKLVEQKTVDDTIILTVSKKS